MTSDRVNHWREEARQLLGLVRGYKAEAQLEGIAFLNPWLRDIEDRIERFLSRLELEQQKIDFPVTVGSSVAGAVEHTSVKGTINAP